MLHESRVHGMLIARRRGYDEDDLAWALQRLSKMVVDLPIAQIDLNPVIVNAKGAFVVDVRVVLNQDGVQGAAT